METLERSRVCRLCGKEAVMSIDIFGKRGNHVKKINMVLPILVHEMDLLPKHMCHPCNYKLQEFHKFYEDCSKTDANLKSQLSWMQRTAEIRDEMMVPMVQINNVKIKTEAFDYDNEGRQTTGDVSKKEEMNYNQNHYTKFHEKFVKISDAPCPHCGCYCDNRNTDRDRHSSNNFSSFRNKFPSKDAIKRNLFATQIFGNKSPRVRLENITHKDSSRLFVKNDADEFQKVAEFDRSDIKIADISPAIPPRASRPGKRGVTLNYQQLSSIKSARRIRKKIVKVKPEVREGCARRLRPRTRTIYYADSKRKRARTEKQIKDLREIGTTRESLDDSKEKNVKKETGVPKDFTEMKIECPPTILTLKSECEELKERRKCRSMITNVNSKDTSRSKNKGRGIQDFKGKIANDDIIAHIRSDKDGKRKSSNVRVLDDKIADNIEQADNSWRKDRKSTFRLRSQGRSAKSKEFRLVSDQAQVTKRENLTDWKKKLGIDRKSSITRHHDCDTCKKRFASRELYQLHGCNSNNRCR